MQLRANETIDLLVPITDSRGRIIYRGNGQSMWKRQKFPRCPGNNRVYFKYDAPIRRSVRSMTRDNAQMKLRQSLFRIRRGRARGRNRVISRYFTDSALHRILSGIHQRGKGPAADFIRELSPPAGVFIPKRDFVGSFFDRDASSCTGNEVLRITIGRKPMDKFLPYSFHPESTSDGSIRLCPDFGCG